MVLLDPAVGVDPRPVTRRLRVVQDRGGSRTGRRRPVLCPTCSSPSAATRPTNTWPTRRGG